MQHRVNFLKGFVSDQVNLIYRTACISPAWQLDFMKEFSGMTQADSSGNLSRHAHANLLNGSQAGHG